MTPKHERASTEGSAWRIVAVELDDVLPRRSSDLPHLYVGLAKVTAEQRLMDLQNGAGPKELSGRYLRLRQDLLIEGGGFESARTAKAKLRKEKNRLARLGHAINGISTVWHTYVIDLDTAGMTDVGKGYVYVGQTSHTPEERYAIHKGEKPVPPARDLRSRVVNKRGLGLNYELMDQLTPKSPVYTQSDALRLERTWAKKLHNMGYRVEAGDATPGRDKTHLL
jgi:hypothetical protein